MKKSKIVTLPVTDVFLEHGTRVAPVVHESHKMDPNGLICVECMACTCHPHPHLLEMECSPIATSFLRGKIKK